MFFIEKMRLNRLLKVLVISALAHSCGYSQLVGKVTAIADGDTFTMLVSNEQTRVRLHGIDCPERGQDFSKAARQFLAEMIFEKEVTVKEMDTDRYGRTIGIVIIDGKNINEELLKAGLAWHYKRYDLNSIWAKFEEQARYEKKGIWSQPNPIPPWDWRKGVR